MKVYNEIYKKQRLKKRLFILKQSLKWLVKIIIVLFLAFTTVYLFGQQLVMIGNSMSPTIENNDVVLINKVSTILFSPKPNDLIAFRPNGNPLANIEIKRIAAVSGDKVKIENGQLYVNGKKIKSDTAPINEPGIAREEITLAKGEFFVLSDNREIMQDSRNADIGMVKKSYCIGNIWFIISPSNRRGLLK